MCKEIARAFFITSVIGVSRFIFSWVYGCMKEGLTAANQGLCESLLGISASLVVGIISGICLFNILRSEKNKEEQKHLTLIAEIREIIAPTEK
jgi:hypothetical protein